MCKFCFSIHILTINLFCALFFFENFLEHFIRSIQNPHLDSEYPYTSVINDVKDLNWCNNKTLLSTIQLPVSLTDICAPLRSWYWVSTPSSKIRRSSWTRRLILSRNQHQSLGFMHLAIQIGKTWSVRRYLTYRLKLCIQELWSVGTQYISAEWINE